MRVAHCDALTHHKVLGEMKRHKRRRLIGFPGLALRQVRRSCCHLNSAKTYKHWYNQTNKLQLWRRQINVSKKSKNKIFREVKYFRHSKTSSSIWFLTVSLNMFTHAGGRSRGVGGSVRHWWAWGTKRWIIQMHHVVFILL